MCGIAGIFHTEQARAVEPTRLERMAGALAHRGPDGSGIWSDGPIGFAHRRLAIIDLAGGRQPMVSRTTGAVLTFNGEIYNFRELRRELQTFGVGFEELSDTEVVLRAYERWGQACVERFQGMFSFAIWDPRARRLFAARDRLGIKPFLYRWDGRTLIFASELKALAAIDEGPREVDLSAFESYLRYQYVPSPQTMIRDARHLRPGRTLTVTENGSLVEHRYWRPHAAVPDHARTDVQEFRSRLTDAVESHLVSDVPVGAFLSGGVDSSLIVALMSTGASRPVHTFSVGFEGARFDERAAARDVAGRFKTTHHECVVTDAEAVASLPRIVQHMDDPLADYAALPTFFVSEIASRHVKVIMTGEGADELFGGYRRYRKERLLAPFSWMRRPYRATNLFSDREIGRLVGRTVPAARRARPAQARSDGINRLCVEDIEGWLPDDLLVKLDRMTMVCSIEGRVPYLDYRLVEFALSVPGHRKVDLLRGTRKVLLREAAAQMLPAEIASRPKHGFTPPIDRWLLGRLGEMARETLLDPASRLRRLVDIREVERLLTSHAEGRSEGHKIWSLLVFELWSQHCAVA